MRLLRARSSFEYYESRFELCEFFGDNIPKYAILSHTWGDEEVTILDMQNGTARPKEGYWKIERCGEQAVADGWDYIWVDTCCIGKASS
jgi:hypothetical protein